MMSNQEAKDYLKIYLRKVLPLISHENQVDFKDLMPYVGEQIEENHEVHPDDIIVAIGLEGGSLPEKGRYWIVTLFGEADSVGNEEYRGFVWIDRDKINRIEKEIPPISFHGHISTASLGKFQSGMETVYSGLRNENKTYFLMKEPHELLLKSRTLNFSRSGFL